MSVAPKSACANVPVRASVSLCGLFQIAIVLAAFVASALALTNPDMKPVIDEALVRKIKESDATFVTSCPSPCPSHTLCTQMGGLAQQPVRLMDPW